MFLFVAAVAYSHEIFYYGHWEYLQVSTLVRGRLYSSCVWK